MDTAGYNVAQLCRYPVKSMLGEELDEGGIGERGLFGDRTHAVVDVATGRVASAKHPRLWRSLLGCAARVLPAEPGCEPRVELTFPDGKTAVVGEDPVDPGLSDLLGRPVHLVDQVPAGAAIDRASPSEVMRRGASALVSVERSVLGGAAPGTFFDFAAVHLLTTATLHRIGELNGPVSPVRYRPNLVVDVPVDERGFVENSWVGRRLQLGSDVLLQVVVATPRCAVPTLAHGSLPASRAALAVLAQHNRIDAVGDEPCAGVYARVLRPGRVRVGDRVTLLA